MRFPRFTGVQLLQERVGRAFFASALLVLALHWMLIIRFVAVRAGDLRFLRLHYTAALGVDWVDRWWYVFSFPLFGLASFLVNLWLAVLLAERRPALGVLMLSATAALEILLAAGGIIAILLNG